MTTCGANELFSACGYCDRCRAQMRALKMAEYEKLLPEKAMSRDERFWYRQFLLAGISLLLLLGLCLYQMWQVAEIRRQDDALVQKDLRQVTRNSVRRATTLKPGEIIQFRTPTIW